MPRFVDELIRQIGELGGATHCGVFRWPGADLEVKKICKAYDDGKCGAEVVRNDDFVATMMNFPLKMMNSVFKMMNSALKGGAVNGSGGLCNGFAEMEPFSAGQWQADPVAGGGIPIVYIHAGD